MGACLGRKTQSGKARPLLKESYKHSTNGSKYPYDAEVTFDFFGSDENQLTISKGEIVIIMDGSPKLNGWALAKRKNDHRQGYIPLDYTKRIKPRKIKSRQIKATSTSTTASTTASTSISLPHDNITRRPSALEAEEIESLLFNELDQVDAALKSRISRENNTKQQTSDRTTPSTEL